MEDSRQYKPHHSNAEWFEDSPVRGYTDETGFPWFNAEDIYRLMHIKEQQGREYITIYDVLGLVEKSKHPDLTMKFIRNVGHIGKAAFGNAFWVLLVDVELALGERRFFERTRPSKDHCYVYLMQNPDSGAVKIGITSDPKTRKGTIASKETALEMLHMRLFPKRQTARELEKHLHGLFKLCRIRGEWFSLSDHELATAIQIIEAYE